MNHESGVRLRWTAGVLTAALLMAAGALAAYLVMKRAEPATARSDAAATQSRGATTAGVLRGIDMTAAPSASDAPLPDVVVTLSEEAVTRAGIEVTPVGTSGTGSRVRLPGTVQPNAYRSVTVTPIVGGRVTRVIGELGQQVRRGQTIAEIYSPELAEAQTRYLSSRAELDAHERELRRTERLVEIGAASRQELEKIHAEHTAATTMVESNRARLTLLGMTEAQVSKLSSSSDISANTTIPAPIDGVITTREANVGLNVEPATPLFTVVDLSTVWVMGDLYEQDFAHVQVGSRATVTTTAYPDLSVEGKVSYIDPQVKPETRTAQVRVEVANRSGQLRLGMYAEMQVGNSRVIGTPVIPRSAVQTVGDRTVVYLAAPQKRGHFVEREVRLGETTGEQVQVVRGVQPGDVVVAKGSFSLRAERERLGLRPPAAEQSRAASVAKSPPSSVPDGQQSSKLQTARVTVSDQGYEPNRLTLRRGTPVRITFTRTSQTTCGTEITFPSLSIRRALPLNQPVEIEFTPQQTGDIAFVCGMKMLSGTIVVQ
jgi:RND family efflux transporter MFP subunit